MSIAENRIIGAVIIGVGASLLMDLWNLFLKRAFGIPSLNYCLLGRWLIHMPEGRFVHESIGVSPKKRLECAMGWMAHYSIGVMLALGFVALASDDWLTRPRMLPALLFGLGTVVFPLLVMQPSMGLGIASSRTPNPTLARLKSLGTHIVFGLGMYASALVLGWMLQEG